MSNRNVHTEHAGQLSLRVATRADIPALRELIAASVRALSVGFYERGQIEAAVSRLFGVDTQLIDDGSYYVVESDSGIVAAGGWSARRTLHGGDDARAGEDPRIGSTEPARIRAFFVHPDWARRGLARRLFAACSRAAFDAGFREFVLVATRPGEPFYASLGFEVVARDAVPIPGHDGVLDVAHMRSSIELPAK